MSDNSLKIAFDYNYPDKAVLLIYKVTSFGLMYGSEPSISIVKTFYDEEAIEMYGKLSGKSIEEIKNKAHGDFFDKHMTVPCNTEVKEEKKRNELGRKETN